MDSPLTLRRNPARTAQRAIPAATSINEIIPGISVF
jgi:hypothetical protein